MKVQSMFTVHHYFLKRFPISDRNTKSEVDFKCIFSLWVNIGQMLFQYRTKKGNISSREAKTKVVKQQAGKVQNFAKCEITNTNTKRSKSAYRLRRLRLSLIPANNAEYRCVLSIARYFVLVEMHKVAKLLGGVAKSEGGFPKREQKRTSSKVAGRGSKK